MSYESEIQTILLADPTIFSITGNRIYTTSEVGPLGITFESTPAVFNADGDVQPTILVQEREALFDGVVIDYIDNEISQVQVIELWIYQDRNYDQIDLLLLRTRKVLNGTPLTNGFELELVLTTGPLQDTGALNKASVKRQDWSINSVY